VLGSSDEANAQPVAAYLALPPRIFGPAVKALGDARLPAGSRIVVEKPFGDSLRTRACSIACLSR